MPTTDDYGQGIQIASLTDAPDGPRLARDLAGGLVPRSNMRFSGAAERDATITAPEEGMEAYLITERLKTVYAGGAWVVAATGSPSWTTLNLASGYAHDGNNNGPAQYTTLTISGARFVVMRGGVSITYSGGTLPNGGSILAGALPTSARPISVRTVNVACSSLSSDVSALKMDAEPDGFLNLAQVSGSTPPWITLNGVLYSL